MKIILRAANFINHTALRQAKIVNNFGLSECNRVELSPIEKGCETENVPFYLSKGISCTVVSSGRGGQVALWVKS